MIPETVEETTEGGLSIRDLLASYVRTCAALENHRAIHFPRRSFVRVEGIGVGVVVATDGCPPHKIPVIVESGNVWFYEMTKCQPAKAKDAGYSLRKIWLARNGYKPLSMSRFRFRHRANAAPSRPESLKQAQP
jgi:hypothetical protein